jgi:hypothetical protein
MHTNIDGKCVPFDPYTNIARPYARFNLNTNIARTRVVFNPYTNIARPYVWFNS